MLILNKLLNLVLLISSKFNIDETHGLTHSMNILYYTNLLYESELYDKPYIRDQEKMIYITSFLHDMCDKKYMNETEGLEFLGKYLDENCLLNKDEINISKKIMSQMSYSKVKKFGFPTDLAQYDIAYHIIRESDLLTGYDFDRSIHYHINNYGKNYIQAFESANDLFNKRVFKHNKDGLFLLDASKIEAKKLDYLAKQRIDFHRKIINKFKFKL